MRSVTTVYISIGSNLDDREEMLLSGLREIRELAIDGAVRSSMIYETEPWGVKDQPIYLNLVVEFATEMDPHKLLIRLEDVEKSVGRVKGSNRWEARKLDLDILLYGDEQISMENLTIPHPRMTERKFVLVPLAELVPDMVLPGKTITVKEALNACRDRSNVNLLLKPILN